MFSSLRTGSILSLQAGMLAPTGDSKRGFGNGTTTFEPFVAFDQLFPTNTWVQFQMGAELPRHTKSLRNRLFWRTAVGQHSRPITAWAGCGRRWWSSWPTAICRTAPSDWDVLPEMQVTISRRQHIRADIGVRTPFTNTAGRSPQVTFYVLWDWADGKLWEGWR